MLPTAQVAAVLRGYADRGVFRDFEDRLERDGGWVAEFRWTLPRRLCLTADAKKGRLVCRDLLPNIEARSPLRCAVDAFVAARHVGLLPEHRRIDPTRVRASSSLRGKQLSLSLRVVDPDDWSYATGKLVNLIHELLLFLNLHWAEYAQQALGAPQD